MIDCSKILRAIRNLHFGMIVDYSKMKAAIGPLLEKYLDHWHLNETTQIENPTAEEIARWIYLKVKPQLPELIGVSLEETCTSRCEYRPSPK